MLEPISNITRFFKVFSSALIRPVVSTLGIIIVRYLLQMKGKGRNKDQALLRTVASKKAQNFATKRLIKDLEEIDKNKVPTVGVTARPLEHDLFLWHANIRGPEGTPYEGGVFHLELQIPASYPHHPPNVKLFTPIPHPNVFGDYICLDILQLNRKQGQGWTSAYSIQSVLMQLQSFLFEEDLNQEKNQQLLNIKKAVKQANQFKCSERNCKHGGRLSCWPPFSTHEVVAQDFLTLDEENDLINKQLICYHTKLHFSQNQLGIGLKISKLPRTGAIREAEALFDYISIKAFLKESINWSATNERFTHWLPLYFGKTDNADRYYKFAKKALSMIINNNTDNFKPQQILEVFPKIIITLIYYIMDEKKHASIRILRILCHVHSCFLFLLQKHPELEGNITKSIDNFIAKEDYRIKDNQPNLGCMLALMSGTDKRKFTDIVQPYFSEQLDRQVLWILKSVPELVNAPKDEAEKKNLEQVRAELVFKSQITSFQIFCFYKLFITDLCERFKTRKELLNHYESNLCKLSNKQEEEFQKKLFNTLKQVKDFDSFFTFVGLRKRSNEELNEMLKTAISNSERKKYHGQFEERHVLPEKGLQLKRLLSKFTSIEQMFDVSIDKIEKKPQKDGKVEKEYKVKITEKAKASEEDWKLMCSQRWAWIKEELMISPKSDADYMSLRATHHFKQGMAKPEDRLFKTINIHYRQKYINYNEPTIKLPSMSWKTLYMRLDIEQFLLQIDMNPTFEELYKKLELCKSVGLTTIVIPITSVENLKSGYHYLCAVLTKLTTLKYVDFCGPSSANNVMDQKAAKSIKKGLTNFRNNKGQLQVFSYQNFNMFKELSDYILSHLGEIETLQSIRFELSNFLSIGNTAKVFSNYLVNLNTLSQLRLSRCDLNVQQAKLLADSIMRLKNLKVVEVKGNRSMGLGLPAIIYNLAFSPKLAMLDISESYVNVGNDEIKELVQSIEKLLKISGSIQVLKARGVAGLNPKLTKDFWGSLGQCRSIRVLDLSLSGSLDGVLPMMGFAIAYNAKKKGSLEYLNMEGCINNNANLNSMYSYMCINEYDEESWYGDPNKLSKMISANYPKKFFNNLRALQLDSCAINPNFNLTQFNKLTIKEDPDLVKLIARSDRLETLSLCKTSQAKSMAEILLLALDPRRSNFSGKLKTLNLSKNSLGKEGAKILAEAIQHNESLQVLDISKNYIGVSGAQALAQSIKNHKSLIFLNLFNNKISFDGAKAIAENVLRNNTTLECLELGHNRIRDKGLKSVVENLEKNPGSKLRIIGLRFNFLTKSGIEEMFSALPKMKCQLEQIYIKNNLIDEVENFSLSQKHQDMKLKVSVDIFQKLKYLEPDRLERTIWIHPVTGFNAQQIRNFFQNTHKCGVVVSVRIRRGKKYPNRVQTDNLFAMVEFADATSVTHALHAASRKWTILNGIKFRVYKAGTGTFIYLKKTSKQKKIEEAKRLLPLLPFDQPSPAEIRGRGGARRVRGTRRK